MKRLVSLLAALLVAGVFCAVVLADTPPVSTTTTAPTVTIPVTTTTEPVVPTGVTMAGVQIGGLPESQAVAAVQAAFEQPVTLRYVGTTITVAPQLLGLRVSADTAVSRALAAAPGTPFALRAGYDRQLVKSFVAKLAKRFDRKPQPSQLLLRGTKPYVTPGVIGRTIDVAKATTDLEGALVHATRQPIALRAKLVQPSVTPKTIGPVIVIRRGDNRLTLYNGMKPVRTFSVATGQNIYPTPLGRFQIVVMWKNPWWYPPTQDAWAKGLKPVPPGPNNPLGTRWMGLNSPGVGIHGTDEPASIGYSLSHGCVRMLVPQAEWLFDHVNVGTPVFIVAA